MFNDKTLLFNGQTRLFGNAVLNKFLETDKSEIRVFSQDENKQDDILHLYRKDKIKFYIGEIRDSESLASAMREVDCVFSAAAFKNKCLPANFIHWKQLKQMFMLQLKR